MDKNSSLNDTSASSQSKMEAERKEELKPVSLGSEIVQED